MASSLTESKSALIILRVKLKYQGHGECIHYSGVNKRVPRSQEWLSVELEPSESRGKG